MVLPHSSNTEQAAGYRITDESFRPYKLQQLEVSCAGPESEVSELPRWFGWALALGGAICDTRQRERRRTAIVTAPCDSSLCGVLALGYLLRSLPALGNSTEEQNHLQRFMDAGRGTKIKRLPREGEKNAQHYRISGHRRDSNEIELHKVTGKHKSGTYILTEKTACQYVFSDDEELKAKRSLAEYVGKPIVSEILATPDREINWHANQNNVVLAGPTAGNAVLRRHTDNLLLNRRRIIDKSEVDDSDADDSEEERLSLSDLLSVREWQHERDCLPYLSRFANASRGDIPAIAEQAKIVFFNGIRSYLTFRTAFGTQDHVIVLSRDTAQTRMHQFLVETHEIRESSERDTCELPAPPNGIQLMSLRDAESEEAQW